MHNLRCVFVFITEKGTQFDVQMVASMALCFLFQEILYNLTELLSTLVIQFHFMQNMFGNVFDGIFPWFYLAVA